MSIQRLGINRARFLAGSLAAAGAVLPFTARGNASATPSVSPDEALARLMAGNKRFVSGNVPALNHVSETRHHLENSQAPFAAILSCSDSRVVPEDVFVVDLGQLFVARVAGNYPDDMVIGSLEYALDHLGTRLVMVLGHENCGAVTAVFDSIGKVAAAPPRRDRALDGPRYRKRCSLKCRYRKSRESKRECGRKETSRYAAVICAGNAQRSRARCRRIL